MSAVRPPVEEVKKSKTQHDDLRSPLELTSVSEFKGCLPRSTCILRDGSIVILLTPPECKKNKFIILCSIRKTDSALEITTSSQPLENPDECRFIFAVGNVIVVAGEDKGYLFNAERNLQSIINVRLIPGSFLVWDENRFIVGRSFRNNPLLFDIKNLATPFCCEIEPTTCHNIFSERGTTFLRLKNLDNGLAVCREFKKPGGYGGYGTETTFTTYHLNPSLNQVERLSYKELLDRGNQHELHGRDDPYDRKIFGWLPDEKLVEVCTGRLRPESKGYKGCEEVLISIHTSNSSTPMQFDYATIPWKIPGITNNTEGLLHNSKDDGDLFFRIIDCSNRISVVGHSVFFLLRSKLSVYDLRNNLPYEITFPSNFRAEGMITWNDQVIIYNERSLYQCKFTDLPVIQEYIQKSLPMMPAPLIFMITDYLNKDIRPPSFFPRPASPRLIDTSEFLVTTQKDERNGCKINSCRIL